MNDERKSKLRKRRQRKKATELKRSLELTLESKCTALKYEQNRVQFLERKCKLAEDRLLSWRHARRVCKTLTTSGVSDYSNPVISKFVKFLSSELVLTTSVEVGEGRFGKCTKGFLQGTQVCVKKMKRCARTPLSLATNEANVLSQLSHPYLCFLHGVLATNGRPYALVTALYTVKGFVITVHDLISGESEDEKKAVIDSIRSNLHANKWLIILKKVAEGLACIHRKEIIHRDIKSDNIVFYESSSENSIHPVIIDFGKAATVGSTRKYTLNDSQKDYYRIHHKHIAPDVIDGKNAPSFSSDIYSYGRLFKCIVTNFPIAVNALPKAIVSTVKKSLQYDPVERPTIESLCKSFEGL